MLYMTTFITSKPLLLKYYILNHAKIAWNIYSVIWETDKKDTNGKLVEFRLIE